VTVPAGWFPDPVRRAERRYWDGTGWTDDAERDGASFKDPIWGDIVPPPSPEGTPRRSRDRAGCQFCGQSPALFVTLRRHQGMFLLMRFIRWDGIVCYAHGSRLVKSFLGRTLLEGWWGLISFFVNWFVIANDLYIWRKIARLRPRAS
jgi:hypothetical protein